VMELVKGIPITEYCDRQNMAFHNRLKLFMQGMAARCSTHIRKGSSTATFKPGNVLVTHCGRQAGPKVIDFGIAKATQARLTEQTMFTEIDSSSARRRTCRRSRPIRSA